MFKILFILFTFIINTAFANDIGYSGRLVKVDGSPVTGSPNLKFEITYSGTPSSIECSETINSVPLNNGVFNVKLNFDATTTCIFNDVLNAVPGSESVRIRVTDLTNTAAYDYQSISNVPLSYKSEISKTAEAVKDGSIVAASLNQMSASTGQVLKWNGSAWAPAADGGAAGTITNITAGLGVLKSGIATSPTLALDVSSSFFDFAANKLNLKDGSVTPVKIPFNTQHFDAANLLQLNLKLNTAGAITSTVTGLGVNVDNTTLEIIGNQLRVKSIPAGNVPDAEGLNTSCADGKVLKASGGSVICSDDIDTNTQLTDTQVDTFVGNELGAGKIPFKSGAELADSELSQDGSGKIGIGTTSPASKLSVSSAGSQLRLDDSANVGVGLGISVQDTGSNNQASFDIVNGGSEHAVFRFFRSTNTTGNKTVLFKKGDGTDTTEGQIGVDGQNSFFQIGGGNFGIGTSSPGSKLEVAGQVKITGGTPGAGKVLTSDAAGLATWQTPGAGADDLGNHTATANIQLGSNWLSPDGSNKGLTVNSSGNIGIGLSNPAGRLHVGESNTGAGDTMIALTKSYDGTGGNRSTTLRMGGSAASKDKSWDIKTVSTSVWYNSPSLKIFRADNTSEDDFIINGNGDIAIGKSTALAKLDVNGNIRATEICDETGSNCKDISAGWTNANATSIEDGLIVDADINASANIAQSKINGLTTSLSNKVETSLVNNGALGTSTTNIPTQNAVKTYVDAEVAGAIANPAGSSTHIQFNNAGAMGASSKLKWDDTSQYLTIGGASGTAALVFKGNTSNAIYNYASGEMRFLNSGIMNFKNHFYMGTNGNFGIGTNSPSTELHVNGNSISSRTNSATQELLKLSQDNTNAASKGSHFSMGLSFYEDPGNNFPRTRVDFNTTDKTTDNTTTPKTVMSLLDGGSVGINTKAPKDNLTVIGSFGMKFSSMLEDKLSGFINGNPIARVSGLGVQYGGELYKVTFSDRGSRFATAFFYRDQKASGLSEIKKINEISNGTYSISASGNAADNLIEFGITPNPVNAGDSYVKIEMAVANDSNYSGTALLINPGATAITTANVATDLSTGVNKFGGKIEATQFVGDGSLLTGISSDSSSNTTNVVVAADSDSNSSGDILFNTAGTTKVKILNNGNVGIGVASPNSKLHVDGVIQSTGLIVRGAGPSFYSGESGKTDYRLTFNTNDADRSELYNYQNGSSPEVFGDIHLGRSTAGGVNVKGSNGNVGVSELNPLAKLHVKKAGVSNKHVGNYATAIIEDTESRLQIISSDAGTNAASVLLTNAPASGNNKHWGIHHTGISNNNRFDIGYGTSAASGDTVNLLSPKVSILTDGSVGVGVTNPLAKLHVSGSALFHTTDNSTPLLISRHAGTSNELLSVGIIDGGANFHLKNDEAYSRFNFRVQNTDTETGGGANANDNTVMSIEGSSSGGRVGIGTSSIALGPLEVKSGTAVGLDDDDDGIVVSNFQPSLYFKDLTSGDPDDARIRADEADIFFETSADFFTSTPTYNTHLTIKQSGNIGVGTRTPAAKLDVNGDIRATQICDETGNNCKDISNGWGGSTASATSMDISWRFWTHNSTDGTHYWTGKGTNFRNCVVEEALQTGETYQNTHVATVLVDVLGASRNTWSSHGEHAKFLRDFNLNGGYTDTSHVHYGSWGTVKYAPLSLERCQVDSGTGHTTLEVPVGNLLTKNIDPASNLTSASEGELAFDTTDKKLQVYNGSAWDNVGQFSKGSSAGDIVYSGGNVGIGTTSPIAPLEVKGGPTLSGGWRRVARLEALHPAIQIKGTAQENKSAWIEYDDATATAGLSLRVAGTGDDIASATRALKISNNGNVGIGTVAPTEKLHVNGNVAITGDLKMAGSDSYIWTNGTGTGYTGIWDTAGARVLLQANESTGNIGIGLVAPTHKLHVNGVARSTQTSFATSSDKRVKENIENVKDGLEKVMALRPVRYNYVEKFTKSQPSLKGRKTGFIAQEVAAVDSSMVNFVEEKFGDETINDFHILSTDNMLPLLVGATQEQQRNIASLEEEVKDLKEENKALRDRLEKIEKALGL